MIRYRQSGKTANQAVTGHACPSNQARGCPSDSSIILLGDRTLELLTISLGEVEKSEESCYMAEGRTAEFCWVDHHSFCHPVGNLAQVADAIGLPIVVGDLVV